MHFMRRGMVLVAAALIAAPAAAQTLERGYIVGTAGFATSTDTTSADVMAEVGGRVARNLSLFAGLGRFRNLQPSDEQPAVDSATATLSSVDGVTAIGTARVPAWYGLGGLRLDVPTHRRLQPYVLGGVGFARLTPTAQFTYSNGTLPDASTPVSGDDITQNVENLGLFTPLSATTAFMFMLGGGVKAPIARHVIADVGYRFSRVAADTPVTTDGVTFGIGYRF